MRIASLVEVLVGGTFWIHSLTISCGVRSFTFMDLGSLHGDLFLAPQRDGEALLSCFLLPHHRREERLCKQLQLGNVSLQSMGSLFPSWRDGEAPVTSLAALPSQCELVCGYHYSFNVSWQKTSRWVLPLSWRG